MNFKKTVIKKSLRKNYLKSLGESNKKNLVTKSRIKLYTRTNSWIYALKSAFHDSDFNISKEIDKIDIDDFVEKLFNITIENDKSTLTKEEIKQRLSLDEFGLINEDYTQFDFTPSKMKLIIDFIFEKIMNDIKTLRKHYTSKLNTIYCLKKLNHQEIKELMVLQNKIFNRYSREYIEYSIIKNYKKKLEVEQKKTIEDMKFHNSEAYLVRFIDDINEAIVSKKIYKIEKYILISDQVGINGQRFNFKPEKKSIENNDVFISNDFNNLSFHGGKNSYIFKTYKEALNYGNTKQEKLLMAISGIEKNIFYREEN